MSRPNARNNPNSAIPVYMVPTPPPGPPWPNKQNSGAIPVTFGAAPTTPNSGPIPVRIVASGSPPDAANEWPNDQGQDAGAIPVYNSPAGMPVWDAT